MTAALFLAAWICAGLLVARVCGFNRLGDD